MVVPYVGETDDALGTHIQDRGVAAAAVVPTEASLQAARCARGEVGDALIRDGRRTVRLGPVGALTFCVTSRVVGARDGATSCAPLRIRARR